MDFPNLHYTSTGPGSSAMLSTSQPIHPPGPRLPLECSCGLCGGLEVPQRAYKPIQLSPDLCLPSGETLCFSKGECGIRVIDAVKNRLSGLVGGDDLMFMNATVSTFSLRIEVSCSSVSMSGVGVLTLWPSGRGTVCGQERCVDLPLCPGQESLRFR